MFIEFLFYSTTGSILSPATFLTVIRVCKVIAEIRLRQSPSTILTGEIAAVAQISDQESGLKRF